MSNWLLLKSDKYLDFRFDAKLYIPSTVNKAQYSTPNFFDRLFLIRAYWNPKSRQGPLSLVNLSLKSTSRLSLKECFDFRLFSEFLVQPFLRPLRSKDIRGWMSNILASKKNHSTNKPSYNQNIFWARCKRKTTDTHLQPFYHFFLWILGLEDGAIGQLGENVQEPVERVLNFGADNVTTPDLHMEVSLALVTEKNTDFAVLVIILNKFYYKMSWVDRIRSVLYTWNRYLNCFGMRGIHRNTAIWNHLLLKQNSNKKSNFKKYLTNTMAGTPSEKL